MAWLSTRAGRQAGGAALTAAVLLASFVSPAAAADRTTFRGCVVERTHADITLHTSARERVTVDTGWISVDALNAVLIDCVTVTAVTIDGRFVAESIEAGDEPNEVNSVTNETTADREERARQRNQNDEKSGKK